MNTWDQFFYYGKNHIQEETRYDLYELLLQPSRTFFYFRKGSSGLDAYENSPNTINLQILARYEIINAILYRNFIVANGVNDSKDRRIIVSQNSIYFKANGSNLDISILYFLYQDYQEIKEVNINLR